MMFEKNIFSWVVFLTTVANLLHYGSSDPLQLHGTQGVFTSPKFPAPYDNNLNITWTVRVSKGFRVALYFTLFDLEDSYEDDLRCPSDFVQIFDGNTNSNLTSGRLCGNPMLYPDDAPSLYSYTFRSSDNVLSLMFVSDYSNDLPETSIPAGFQAVYKAEDIDECEELQEKFDNSEYPETVGKCDHYCSNFLGRYQCSCKEGYQLHENGYTCTGRCSGIHTTQSSGVITSPGYPDNYPKLTDCDWTIETDVGQVIELNFDNNFDIEDYYSVVCPYDWMKIYNDDEVTTHCGATAPKSIVSVGNVIKIEFHSDMVTELKGFKVSHRNRGVYCELPTPPAHGRVVETYGAENGRLPFDSVVVFECELNYEMKGVHKIACLKDGTFDDFVPVCLSQK